jgi:TonB family protein
MEIKKTKNADLEKSRFIFFQTGLIVAMGIVLLSMEWSVPVCEQRSHEINLIDLEMDINSSYHEHVSSLGAFCNIQDLQEKREKKKKIYQIFSTYFNAHFNYPKEALLHNIQGKVYVRFYIDKHQQIKNAQIIKGVNHSLNEEVLRLLKTFPDEFNKARKDQVLNGWFTIPVHCIIQNERNFL